jgi:LysM repeat protein
MAEKVKVKSGDNMSAIAAKAGVSLAAMKAANPQISNPSLIKPGQVLNVPAPTPTAATVSAQAKAMITKLETRLKEMETSNAATIAENTAAQAALDKDKKDQFTANEALAKDLGRTYDPKTGKIGGPISTVTDKKFPAVGTLLRYVAGKTSGFRIPVYADGKGGEFEGQETLNPVNPGSTGFSDISTTATTTITLASNTFANTVALLMGETEATQSWVEELRQLAQGFINTGSDTDEAINLALRDAKAKGKASKFVQRFDAIFKLQDRLNAGEAVQVPTIAEYVKSEQALGDVFRNMGLPELATQTVTSKVLGEANKSVAEATAIITDIFGAIDNAPSALKADLQALAPGVDRTGIAKALLLGKDGILELTKKVASISQVSAAKSQGVTITSAMGSDLAAGGAQYGTSLTKFGEVKRLERGQSLGRMSNINFTQDDAIASTFNSSAAANEKIRKIEEEERNRFTARIGRLASQNRSSGQI